MGIYEALGVRTLVNAAGTVTNYGGSVMAPEVFAVMQEANRRFCRLEELQRQVGERIAAMLDVEAAYVTSSAAAGLLVTTAACMAGADPERIAQLPDPAGMKSQVVVQRSHRLAYDQAMRLAGAAFVEVEDDGAPPVQALRAVVGAGTAAILCMAHRLSDPSSVSLDDLVSIARAAGVPLIVDAASESPPPSTLTRFWKAGADLTIFSGGKSIMGPQSTGLVIGRKDLIAACAANGNPFAAVGRPAKVSREEIIGLLKALELYLARDHDADRARWEAQIDHVERALARAGRPIALERMVKGDTYTVPMLALRTLPDAGFTTGQLCEELLAGDPRVVLAQHFIGDGVVVNPHMLQPGQERIVAERCLQVLEQLDQPAAAASRAQSS